MVMVADVLRMVTKDGFVNCVQCISICRVCDSLASIGVMLVACAVIFTRLYIQSLRRNEAKRRSRLCVKDISKDQIKANI